MKDESVPQLFVGKDEGPMTRWSDDAVAAFLNRLDINATEDVVSFEDDRRADATDRIVERQARCVRQAEEHVQSLIHQSEHVRDEFFLYSVKPEWQDRRWSTDRSHPVETPDAFIAAATDFRKKFATEAMGRFDLPLGGEANGDTALL